MLSKFFNFIKPAIPLIIILVAALILRLSSYIGVVRDDDILYAQSAYLLSVDSLITTGNSTTTRSGLFTITSLIYRFLGPSEASTIFFPLAASITGVVFIYGIACILAGKKAGILAAMLWTLFPLDINLATQFLPDGPLVMTTSGTVYFYLMALRQEGKKRLGYIVLTLAFLYWSFKVKESSITLVFVLLLFTMIYLFQKHNLWQNYLADFAKQFKVLAVLAFVLILGITSFMAFQPNKPTFFNNLELTATDITDVWILGKQNPVSAGDIGTGYWQVEREIHQIAAETEVFSSSKMIGYQPMFFILTPLIFVALITLKKDWNLKYLFLIVWAATYFVYFEWGSYPRGFHFPNILYYTPVIYWVDIRNSLFLLVPFVLIIAVFLATIKKINISNGILFIQFFLAIIIAIAIHPDKISPNYQNLMDLVVVLGIIAIIASPFVFGAAQLDVKQKSTLLYALVGLIFFAFAKPDPLLHHSEYAYENDRKANYQNAANFLLEEPDIPIFTQEGIASRLNFYSEFELGYDIANSGISVPQSRINLRFEELENYDKTYVVYAANVSDEFIGPDWWLISRYGEGKSGLKIFLTKSPEVAQDELIFAQQQAQLDPSIKNMEAMLEAAVIANDIKTVGIAWAALEEIAPGQYPFSSIEHFLIQALAGSNNRQIISSPSATEMLSEWQFTETLYPQVKAGEHGDFLLVGMEKKAETYETISMSVELKPSTVYALQTTLNSSAVLDVLFLEEGYIRDSWELGEKFEEMKTVQVFFVTPPWNSSQQLELVFFTLSDIGHLNIYDFTFFELSSLDDIP